MGRINYKLGALEEGFFSLSGLNDGEPHTQVGIKFLNNSEEVTPSAGTFTISVRPKGSSVFEPIQLGEDVDATKPILSLSYTAIGDKFKFTPNGITGADLVQFTLSSTRA